MNGEYLRSDSGDKLGEAVNNIDSIVLAGQEAAEAVPPINNDNLDFPTTPPVLSPPLRCVDLFAGAGGFSLSAQLAGMRVDAAIEINKHACDTYRHNFIRTDAVDKPILYNEDISHFAPDVLRRDLMSRQRGCDIVLGGPPCQGFSVHRIKNAGVDDPRNSLVLRYFEYVKCLAPKAFLMENVPGLLWPRHKAFLDEFIAQSKIAKYKLLGPIKIDARDYGVPQRRLRVFILGVREDVHFDESQWPPKKTHGDEKSCLVDPSLKKWISSRDVFEKPTIPSDENDVHMNHSPELIKVFEATPVNGSRRDSNRVLQCHRDHSGHSDVYGRINLDEPGPTMTTACINPSKGRFVHPTAHHGITVRQAARFQTFPESFIFKGGLIASGVQVGNAVPVELGRILLRAVSLGLGVKPNE